MNSNRKSAKIKHTNSSRRIFPRYREVPISISENPIFRCSCIYIYMVSPPPGIPLLNEFNKDSVAVDSPISDVKVACMICSHLLWHVLVQRWCGWINIQPGWLLHHPFRTYGHPHIVLCSEYARASDWDPTWHFMVELELLYAPRPPSGAGAAICTLLKEMGMPPPSS